MNAINSALAASKLSRSSGDTAPTAFNGRTRIDSVDVVRGIIMIIMVLDHTREYFGASGVSPTNLATTTVPLFFTRWITYFCAPVFFLLTGTGAFLSLEKKGKQKLSRFLVTRGLWLIFVELVVLRCLGWQYNFDYQLTVLQVLWALGWSMITLSALVYLPVSMVSAFGVLMMAGHNLFDSVRPNNPLWTILHASGFVVVKPPHIVFAAYPLIPWIGVTAAGFGLGQIYRWSHERRKKFLLSSGVAFTALFVVLRSINIYGDPSKLTVQPSGLFTVLSFINTTKYPPSLLFLLMTLGPAMLLLWAFDGGTPRMLRPALIVGRVPMFYFLLHVPMLHSLAIFASFARYGETHWMYESPTLDRYPITQPPGWGFSLPVVYFVWLSVVVLLYPLCKWFAGFKQRRKDAWLSYL